MRVFTTLLLALALGGCAPFFFQPGPTPVVTPDRYGLAYQQVELHAADGTELFAWFLPARGEAKATVLYLHGTAENISTSFANVAWMPAAGFNILALDYRGYGDSEGRPTLAGVQLDIDAAMRSLLERPGVDPDHIIVFGQSLGGALAIHYVAHSAYRRHIRAVVVDSAFADYRLMAQQKAADHFITWPLQWFSAFVVDNDYSPLASVAALSPIPLLLIHGERDDVVPAAHSQILFEGAHEPKDYWTIRGSGHIGALRRAEVRQRLAEFLSYSAATRPGSAESGGGRISIGEWPSRAGNGSGAM